METPAASKKGKKIGLLVGLLVFAIAYYGTRQLFKTDVAAELKEAALELNRMAPMQVDAYSRLDSATSIGKTNFVYHYTMLGVDKGQVNLDTLNTYLRPNIIQTLKTSPELQSFREHRIRMDYRYYDQNGSFVTEISIAPEQYTP